MKPELIEKIKNCGVKKSVIEDDLKMPKNSLSGMMNGSRPTPEKWEVKLEAYFSGKKSTHKLTKPSMKELKESISDIKPASDPKELIFAKPTPKSYDGEKAKSTLIDEMGQWKEPINFKIPENLAIIYKEVDDLCEELGITPSELAAKYKILVKTLDARKTPVKESGKVIVTDLNQQAIPKGSNYFTNYAIRKSQGGQKPDK